MDTIEVQNNVHLERLLTTDKEMEQYIRTAIGYVMEKARRDVVSAANAAMTSDPRGAAKAIRRTLYKQVLGANLNILNKRRAKGGGGSGGSRRGRTKDTERYLSYNGSDRGFILRFINAGTKNRVTTHMNGHAILRSEKVKWHSYRSGEIGGRGAIRARNWFGNNSQRAMEEAAAQFSTLIDQLIKQTIGNG